MAPIDALVETKSEVQNGIPVTVTVIKFLKVKEHVEEWRPAIPWKIRFLRQGIKIGEVLPITTPGNNNEGPEKGVWNPITHLNSILEKAPKDSKTHAILVDGLDRLDDCAMAINALKIDIANAYEMINSESINVGALRAVDTAAEEMLKLLTDKAFKPLGTEESATFDKGTQEHVDSFKSFLAKTKQDNADVVEKEKERTKDAYASINGWTELLKAFQDIEDDLVIRIYTAFAKTAEIDLGIVISDKEIAQLKEALKAKEETKASLQKTTVELGDGKAMDPVTEYLTKKTGR